MAVSLFISCVWLSLGALFWTAAHAWTTKARGKEADFIQYRLELSGLVALGVFLAGLASTA